MKIDYNVLLDYQPREWVFSTITRLELIHGYFSTSLSQGSGYEILKGLGQYYDSLLRLESNLNNLVKVVSMGEIQLRGKGKAQFRLSLFEGCTVMATLHLFRLGRRDYYELFHEEGNREIVLGEAELKGNELVDVFQGLFLHLAGLPA